MTDGRDNAVTSREQFDRDGYVFPLRAMPADDAAHYYEHLLAYEARAGGPIHGDHTSKAHLLFTWANDLIRDSRILDPVEAVLGPDILCWETNIIIKEANDERYIAWHQDRTYWGLDPIGETLTAWLALTDTTRGNGAMRFIPGSHRLGQLPHVETMREHNVTSRKQEVLDVDESQAMDVELSPGEMSLHHLGMLHKSGPNPSTDRRVGVAIRYISATTRQLGTRESSMLVRGRDCGHFELEPDPRADLDADALAAHRTALELNLANYYAGVDRSNYGETHGTPPS